MVPCYTQRYCCDILETWLRRCIAVRHPHLHPIPGLPAGHIALPDPASASPEQTQTAMAIPRLCPATRIHRYSCQRRRSGSSGKAVPAIIRAKAILGALAEFWEPVGGVELGANPLVHRLPDFASVGSSENTHRRRGDSHPCPIGRVGHYAVQEQPAKFWLPLFPGRMLR